VAGAYRGERVPLGQIMADGTRNEDVTRLTFPDESFDAVFSLDLLDRVPDYRRALREFARCLRPGARLVLTVPFHFDRTGTLERGTSGSDGRAGGPGPQHRHDFGWDLLDALREAGFCETELAVFTAPHYGYVGLQYVIAARRGPERPGPGEPSGRGGAGHAGH
jgi:SAM-dependent methyltransferase